MEKMGNKSSSKLRLLALSAVIAAMYAVLTLVAATLNLAYGPVQFRISEALTVLPVFTPAAIPGLALGCFIGNLGSPFGVVDWVFGTFATLLAAIGTFILAKVRIKGIPLLAPLPPVIFNMLIIGFEISCFSVANEFSFSNFTLEAFVPAALWVGVGQAVICYGLGLPLIIMLNKTGVFDKIN